MRSCIGCILNINGIPCSIFRTYNITFAKRPKLVRDISFIDKMCGLQKPANDSPGYDLKNFEPPLLKITKGRNFRHYGIVSRNLINWDTPRHLNLWFASVSHEWRDTTGSHERDFSPKKREEAWHILHLIHTGLMQTQWGRQGFDTCIYIYIYALSIYIGYVLEGEGNLYRCSDTMREIVGSVPINDMQTDPLLQKWSYWNKNCAMCWNDWTINFRCLFLRI